MISAKWTFRVSPPREKLQELSRDTDLHPMVCQILMNRGLETPEAICSFLEPDLRQILDPFLMKGMGSAVERIRHALDKGEQILIHGDYDVDGITASAILAEYLTGAGGRVQVRLPNRIKDGYGLGKRVIEDAHRNGIPLIITVDCGSSDHDAAECARRLGIDLIITDHHHLPETLPKTYAIINPRQRDCAYPYKDLAGVGVALKLIQALTLAGQGRQMSLNQTGFWPSSLNPYLDLVCLGTIADIMPLTGENRALVKFGLQALEQTARPGITALKEIAGIAGKQMTAGMVAFGLAPRINATGRMWGPEEGLKLMLTKCPQEGGYLARFLNQQNQKRRQTEEKILAEARKKIQKHIDTAKEMVIILSDKDWHPGVIGIVAQKLVEEFYRPTVIIALHSGLGKGSARSIPSVHLYELLNQCQDLLKDFGGHAAAAGLTIEERLIPAFRDQINRICKERYRFEDLMPEMTIDAEVDTASIDYSLISQLERLAPFGCANPEPSLCLRRVCIALPPRLLKEAHLKMHLKAGPVIHEAIGFNMPHHLKQIISMPYDHYWDIIFYPQINTWQGTNQIQLRLKDIKSHAAY